MLSRNPCDIAFRAVSLSAEHNRSEGLRAAVLRNAPLRTASRRGGGYMRVDEIMENSEARAEMLAQAKSDLVAWKQRYDHLVEITKIWPKIEIAMNGFILMDCEI